ncbi:MAG: hypothetical protein H0W25_01860 [Acidimicrobiia bacterium]|nr:hypothetical protein [Acidimicrobiia bacterium]
MELVKWLRLQWDRALGGVAMGLGVLLLVVGWIEVSSTEFVAAQIPYVVSAGLGGLVALMLGGTLWLSADLRDEWRVLDRIDQKLAEGDELVEALEGRLAELEERVAASPAQPANGSVTAPRRRAGTAGGSHS